ncbi:hypothetical protein CO709_13400 [Burkholderia thailandensis]|nr:hypothetical protein CO709_13400 [Burkholderia thailandensis]
MPPLIRLIEKTTSAISAIMTKTLQDVGLAESHKKNSDKRKREGRPERELGAAFDGALAPGGAAPGRL